jgi:hypothetical protein
LVYLQGLKGIPLNKLTLALFLVILCTVADTSIATAQEKLQGVLPLDQMDVVYDTIISTHASKSDIYARAQQFLKDNRYSNYDSSGDLSKPRNLLEGSGYFYVAWKETFLETLPVQAWHTLRISLIDSACRIQMRFSKMRIVRKQSTEDSDLLNFATRHNAHSSLLELNDRADQLIGRCIADLQRVGNP